MTIQTKFNLGDEVAYTYEHEIVEVIKCLKCKGKGIILAMIEEIHYEVKCPFCNGAGNSTLRTRETVTEEHIVNRVMYDSQSSWMNIDKIHYGFCNRLKYQPTWNVFSESKCTLVKSSALHFQEDQT